MARISEKKLEDAIEKALVKKKPVAGEGVTLSSERGVSYVEGIPGGFIKQKPEDYNRELCLDPQMAIAFIYATQPEEWEKLKKFHGKEIKEKFLKRLSIEVSKRGTMDVLRWPPHRAFERTSVDGPVRVDAGVREGDAITPYYDPMIAKLIVWGDNRAQALARLDAALAATHIAGLHTNVAFLRRVVASTAFATADLDTALIERERAVLLDQPPLALEIAAAGVVARALADEAELEGADPWSRLDGWRLHGGARRHFDIEHAGVVHAVALARPHRPSAQARSELQIGVQRWAISSRALGGGQYDTTLGERRLRLAVYAQGERVAVFAPEASAVLRQIDAIAHAGEGAAEGGSLTAPMPGKVIAFLAQVGDAVIQGQALAVMEAMKMEHTLTAPRDGRISEISATAGMQTTDGAILVRLEALPE